MIALPGFNGALLTNSRQGYRQGPGCAAGPLPAQPCTPGRTLTVLAQLMRPVDRIFPYFFFFLPFFFFFVFSFVMAPVAASATTITSLDAPN